MPIDALQNIDQVVVRTDLVQTTGREQTLDDADLFGAELGPGEQPITAAHGNHSQGALEVVGVHGHIRIIQEDFQPYATLARIAECLSKGTAR